MVICKNCKAIGTTSDPLGVFQHLGFKLPRTCAPCYQEYGALNDRWKNKKW